MAYSYRRGFPLTENKKRLIIYALAVVLVLSLFVFGRIVTSYVVYADQIGKELNETKSVLSACEIELDNANSDIAMCLSDYAGTKSASDACRLGLESNKALLEACDNGTAALKAEKSGLEARYDALAVHAAADICCARGIQSASWSIADDFILCSGNRTVNCTA